MSLQELRKKPHLSYSAINEYIMCGKKYELSRVKNFKPEFEPDNLIFGKAIHKVLADFNQDRMIGNILSIQELKDKFEEYWTGGAKENAAIRYGKNKDFYSHLFVGFDLLKAFHENQTTETNTILAIEEPFKFQIDGLDLLIIGAYDLVEEDEKGTIIIKDYKTASKTINCNDIDNNLQLTLYQLSAKSNGYAGRDIILKIEAMIKTKTPKVEKYFTQRSEIDEIRSIRKIKSVWEAISHKVFLPSSDGTWMCKTCQYKTYCDNWFLNRDEEI